eukprot:TRINITY_DN30864_c0_g1_i2.p1 TRINITY_DN30864_c0_g1~~TRINITY_DN30864_c0_g1_i2.p1  ORF type:complete len:233 (+),score=95.56 TRINITY_DN30864_c0_g1_i2:76-774(+)
MLILDFFFVLYIVSFILCLFFFFFFKQKTAYEMLRSLVGSEMCIRDSFPSLSYSEIAVCASNPQSTQFDFRAAAKDLIDRKNGLVARNGTFDPEFDGTNEQAVRAQCAKEHVAAARLERIEEITNDRVKLMEHIAYRGPVFVGLNAVPLQTYQGGILRCPASATTTDAYMVVVGYDHSDHMNGNGFWIVKAAWGSNFGERGHARISMEDGACGIGKIGFSAHMMRLAGTKLH